MNNNGHLITLSIIIVNYNGFEFARKCIESILSSNTKVSCEIILVDNGSDDNSVERLREGFAESTRPLVFVTLKKNFGPARARNEGASLAKGRYLSFLDNDTIVHPNWVDSAIEEFEKDQKLGIIQCKLLLEKQRDKIDYVGEYLGSNGFLIQRAYAGEVDNGQYDQKVDILAAKSAGMFIRRETFEAIGGFDSDYFIYMEETDLGLRSWLAGYQAIFLPESVVYHVFGSSVLAVGSKQNNYNVKFHGPKNYIRTLLKSLQVLSLLKILPVHVFLWLALAWFSLFKGKGRDFLYIHKAVFWNFLHIRATLKKRKFVQQARTISDAELFKIVMRKKSWKYFFAKAVQKQKVGNAESFNKS